MKDLANKIAALAEEVSANKSLKKRIRKFNAYLEDWGISRLTSSKRAEIEDLLLRNNLEFILPYSENEKADLKTYEKDKGIVLRYSKSITYNLDEIGKREADNTEWLIYKVANGDCPKTPFPFQKEAILKLSRFFKDSTNRKGLLVMPTGSGKTFTAMHWLLRNAVNENKKVIWVAHRQELLKQTAAEVGKLCYENVLPKRKNGNVSVHLISGSSDNANKINKNDDIVVASIQTLNRNLDKLKNQFLKYNKDVFLVIDEAHHATADSYRALIKTVQDTCTDYNMFGLTATPYRTAKDEKSLLAQVFNPELIFSIDLTKLITEKYLADPHFVPIDTDISFSKADLSEKEIDALQKHSDLPEAIKKKILERKDRDRFIVDHYIQNKEKYKQTIVFALDRNHAITLSTLFKNKGLRTNFVISGTETDIGITRTNEDNQKAIHDFREGKLDTIVNVNILTEGTDLPKTQTVFLTRPTKSKILMTQMVGRALRGTKAGGTEKAFIVSFIDNWDDLVAWQSPDVLFNDGILPDQKHTPQQRDYAVQLISIEMLQQFALLADTFANTTKLQNLPAILRIPVGWYGFDLEHKYENEEPDIRSHKVLVFQHHKEAFDALSSNIESIFKKYDYNKNTKLEGTEKQDLLTEVKQRFFDIIEYPEPKIKERDLRYFVDYYEANQALPPYFTFEERDALDITSLANEMIKRDFRISEKETFINQNWEGENGHSIWKQFFNGNLRFFRAQLDQEVLRIQHPSADPAIPALTYGQEKLEDRALFYWPPKECRQMIEAVFAKHNKENPKDKIENKDRFKYDIDHIYPLSEGGKTALSNLRPLLRWKNKQKGNKVE